MQKWQYKCRGQTDSLTINETKIRTRMAKDSARIYLIIRQL